jgi:hypothetical protein
VRKRVPLKASLFVQPLDAPDDFGKLPLSFPELQGMEMPNAQTATPSFETYEPQSLSDFEYPQREAAFFFGLFLRGHSVEQLRRDIQVPPDVLAKWDKEIRRQPGQRAAFDRILQFRRNVLAIFEYLLLHDSQGQRLQ